MIQNWLQKRRTETTNQRRIGRKNHLLRAIRSRCQGLRELNSQSFQDRSTALRDYLWTCGNPPPLKKLFASRCALLKEAFALATEAIRRTTHKEFYDVQLLAGHALTCGSIAQMQTGEGKTLTTMLPAYTWALFGQGVHVATTNEYLASRDYEELKPSFQMLGLSVGRISRDQSPREKRQAYAKDVTYGTGYEFGFDFLRDQLSLRRRQKPRLGDLTLASLTGHEINAHAFLQRPHQFMIVDEADSVMIDEASMPLVLSLPVSIQTPPQLFEQARDLVDRLAIDNHYELDPFQRTITFTDAGWDLIHEALQYSTTQGLRRPWSQYVQQAIRAKRFLQRDVDYVVQEGAVSIVDQQTGRIHDERTWRDGLHQSVEVREGLAPSPEKDSECKVTRQRFFRYYQHLCGMTGTTDGSEPEFRKFYQMSVVRIPTHRPCQRIYRPTRLFKDNVSRNRAITLEVSRIHDTGQPILIGTRTINHSKQLSELLQTMGYPHELLNGIQTKDEAEIVAKAGMFRQITIATNMAGRGTDIQPDSRSIEQGGLSVLAAEHNPSCRVDRQLAGRAARQGDPGTVQFFASVEDELFLGEAATTRRRLARFLNDDGEFNTNLDHWILKLQRKTERLHYQRRLEMQKRDQWMDSVLETLAKTV